ncbi:MAG TPA: ABC transporter substrate-binding protein, partial [Beutenbergiaceae bacterium]|nr:ABC transporter substrate-binding protein [Beutenbergiaceae bacterium]
KDLMTDYIVAMPNDTTEFNESWRNVVGSAGYMVANNIFSRLVVTETESLSSFPDLAHHWERLDGARRWRFQLNQHARWHDGERLTAHDVAYTHRHAIEHKYHAASFLSDVADIEVLDDYTVEYNLKAPNSAFLTPMGNFVATHILPRHLFEGTDWATNPHNQNPVGSGPFRFVEHIPGDRVVLEAWPEYWGPPPGVDRVIVKIVEDRDEIIRMIKDGEADYCPQDVLTTKRLPQAPETETRTVSRKRGPGVATLSFNNHREQWDDRRLREAVALAVNRADLEPLVDPGYSEPWAHYLPGSSYAFAPEVKAPDHDKAGAEALLDKVGLTAGEDGVRARWTGYYMETFDGHKAIGAVLSKNLAAVGIECEFLPLSSDDWLEKISRDHDFDLIISGGNMIPEPDITASRFETGGLRNASGLSNPAVDEAYRAGRAALDRDERIGHYRRLQEAFRDDVCWVPLFWYCNYAYRSTKLFGWSDQIDFRVPWWHWGRLRPVE